MERHHAKFYGEVVTIRYSYGHHGWYRGHSSIRTIGTDRHVTKSDLLWEGEIEQPLIEVGEMIYIPKLNIETKVVKRVRDVEGGRIYYTDYIVEEIEDEESKIRAEKEQEEEEKRNKEYREEQRKNAEKESDLHIEEDEGGNKWYQFWK